MKKRYYIYFSLGMIAIFLLQTLYIGSLYRNFLHAEQENINETIYEAIDLELHHRIVKSQTPEDEVEYKVGISNSRITLDQMPIELQRGMRNFLAAASKPIYEWVDIQDLINRKVIRSKGDLRTQQDQDWYRENGVLIDIHILDSLFDSRLSRNYENKICLLDSGNRIVCTEGDSIEYNYTTQKFPIGLKGEQSIIAHVNIAPSRFIILSVTILISSLLIVLLSLFTLAYLITILRRKDEKLKSRETNINGIIHDLKSPLVGISAMLDLYYLLEQDTEKREILMRNKNSVKLLCSNIERLLAATKDRIEIVKEPISAKQLQDRTQTLVEELKSKYNNNVVIVNTTFRNLVNINIDILCFDSVITNLVDNAIKYSENNIDIDLEITYLNKYLCIIVSDKGIGINKKESKKIFKHLYRGNHKDIKGYGIGLTYVRTFARAHGGDAKLIFSEIGMGSKFKVVINVEE